MEYEQKNAEGRKKSASWEKEKEKLGLVQCKEALP